MQNTPKLVIDVTETRGAAVPPFCVHWQASLRQHKPKLNAKISVGTTVTQGIVGDDVWLKIHRRHGI